MSLFQLFIEDLHGNANKGFLHSIPDDIHDNNNVNLLQRALNNCMHCSDINCDNRFNSANELLQIFDNILEKLKFL